MKKFTLFFLVLTLISLGKYTVKAQAPAQCQDIMLQAFYWDSYADSKWTNLNSKAGEIASNFSLVWLPPSGNVNSSNNMGYFPIYWFDQNSAFGTQAELKTLISTLKANNVKTIADVVVNHRSGVSSWIDLATETYNGVTYPMGPAQICSNDECVAAGYPVSGAMDTGEGFNGSRDLDHTSTVVRNDIKGYMQFLKNEIGYSGWRYDFTKGFSASYVNEYNAAAAGYFSVGEYFDGNYDLVKSWINSCSNNSTSFDFPLKFALNSAMWNGGMDLTKLVWVADGTLQQPAGLIHHSTTKRYAVTFVDNHDTYKDNNKFTGNVLAAYAFLMGSPGVPCVLLAHWNANKAAISAMIYARRSVQLHSESSVTVNQSSANLYVATASGFNGTLIVKIGNGSYSAPAGYTLAASGTDYAIWTKTITNVAPSLTVSPSGGTYYSPQAVTLSTNTGASIYYTTNNTAPTASSTLYSAPLNISGTTTLRAIAYNPTTLLYSAETTNTYTFSTVPTSIKVRFKAPVEWPACNVYSWYNSTPLTAAWPGNAMTKESDGYYSYTVSGLTVVPIGIVFNNGTGTSQTYDLSTSTYMCWDAGVPSGTKYYTALETTCLFTGIDNPAEGLLRFYPNPTHDLIYFTIPKGYDNVIVTSSIGNKLLVKPALTSGFCQIDLSGYPAGVYYISLTGPNENRVTKAVMKY